MPFKWYFTQMMFKFGFRDLDSIFELDISNVWEQTDFWGGGGGGGRERGLIFPSVWPILSFYGRSLSCDLGWLWFTFHT